MPKDAPKPNRLAAAASPYLRQHAANPVDWYPWGDEALQLAKKLDRPIFLSVGYSACHWCHVMAKESFEDPAIAALLNERFVCIKVDREERPDVDEIYMAAVQAMGQQGGWPLSVWLRPDGKPFYGGTYFPPEDAHGLPAFRRVLESLDKAWREKRAEIDKGADELAAHLQKALAPELVAGDPDASLTRGLLARSRTRYDASGGGFGEAPSFAPKFPPSRELQVLLRLGDDGATAMAKKTLLAMQFGGIHDQLGGGFHRYSTDRAWLVPHFEKMLYDNALLVNTYLDAFEATGEATFAATARDTLDWMLRDMRHERGGFVASQDAQSDGVEGRFFVWTATEFDAVLGDDAAFAKEWFGVTSGGNHEGANVLSLPRGLPTEPADRERLVRVKAALLVARDRRTKPAVDDKVLAAWNGLAIGACARGFRALGDERYLDAARRAADFVLGALVHEGRCSRHWHSGAAQKAGFLEDHTMLAEGLVALFETDGDPRWLGAARDLLATVRKHFAAPDGGFWATADDAEPLLARTRSPFESSTPSGVACAVHAMLRAGLLLADPALVDAGVAALRANHQAMKDAPTAVPSLLLAAQFWLADPREVVVAGEPGDARTQALLVAAWRGFPHHRVVAPVNAANREKLAAMSAVFDGKVPLDGAPAAYVCRRGVCLAPVTDPAALVRLR